MISVAIWILLVSANGYTPTVMGRFEKEADCTKAQKQLEERSNTWSHVHYAGLCTPANVIKDW